jgi:hypothetical protein
MISFVRSQINESKAATYSDDLITTYIQMGLNQFQTDTKAIEVQEEIVFTPDTVTGINAKNEIQIVVPAGQSGLYWVDQDFPKLFSLFDSSGKEYPFQFWDESYMEPPTDTGIIYIQIMQGSPADYIARKLAGAIVLSSPFEAVANADTVTITWKTPGAVANPFTDPAISGFVITQTVVGTGKCYFLKYRLHSFVAASLPLTEENRDYFSAGPKMNYVRMKDWMAGRPEVLSMYHCFTVDPMKREIYFADKAGVANITYRPVISRVDIDDILTNHVSDDYCNTIIEYAVYLAYQKDKDPTANERLSNYYRFAKQIKADLVVRQPDDVYGFVSFNDNRVGKG